MKAFINSKKEPLTVERLKNFKGMENLTDAEAEAIVLDIKILSGLLIEVLNEENKSSNIDQLKQAA
jgi:hypothetical protein